MKLVSCAGCSRHVRSADVTCPFCGSTARLQPASASTRGRVIRAAILVGVATTAAACGGELVTNTDASSDGKVVDAPKDAPVIVPYGVPPHDAGQADVTIAPPYGVPPRDQ